MSVESDKITQIATLEQQLEAQQINELQLESKCKQFTGRELRMIYTLKRK